MRNKATEAVDKVREHYLSRKYDNVEEIVYTENVVDLSDIEEYVINNDTIVITSDEEITKDEVLILPGNDEYQSLIALKVTNVEKNGNNYTLNVEEPEITDIVDNMNVEFSQSVNFENFIPEEGVKIVKSEEKSSRSSIKKDKESFEFGESGTLAELEINITDGKLKLSSEWEEANGNINLTEAGNYALGPNGDLLSKFDNGYEIIGKVKIKDLIVNGNFELEDDKVAFDVNAKATVDASLSMKGNISGKSIKIGKITTKNPLSPVTFVIDVYLNVDFEGEISIYM